MCEQNQGGVLKQLVQLARPELSRWTLAFLSGKDTHLRGVLQ